MNQAMKNQQDYEESNVIPFIPPKPDGKGPSGFDYFITMILGTAFAVSPNNERTSRLREYRLCSKQGVTVLLQNEEGEFERHHGGRFCDLNTLVQILHVPKEKEETNGNSVQD